MSDTLKSYLLKAVLVLAGVVTGAGGYHACTGRHCQCSPVCQCAEDGCCKGGCKDCQPAK